MFYPSLEPSQRDGSNAGSQHTFQRSDKENYPFYPFLSGALAAVLNFFGNVWIIP